jgi:hypothetical protein
MEAAVVDVAAGSSSGAIGPDDVVATVGSVAAAGAAATRESAIAAK